MGGYSSNTIDILHLSFTPRDARISELSVSPTTESKTEASTCGWSACPCQSVATAYAHRFTESKNLTIIRKDGVHASERRPTTFDQTCVIEGKERDRVIKNVSSIQN